MTISDDIKARLTDIDGRLESFLTGNARGKKSGELADALHRLVWCVRDLSDEVSRMRKEG